MLKRAAMLNSLSGLCVTKLDVLDELAEIPVCVSYKIDGKATDEVPAQCSGYDRIDCIYRKMPGWRASTQGITMMEKLPIAAREYLQFLESASGARIGMVSTGPGREQTILADEFAAEMAASTRGGRLRRSSRSPRPGAPGNSRCRTL